MVSPGTNVNHYSQYPFHRNGQSPRAGAHWRSSLARHRRAGPRPHCRCLRFDDPDQIVTDGDALEASTSTCSTSPDKDLLFDPVQMPLGVPLDVMYAQFRRFSHMVPVLAPWVGRSGLWAAVGH